MTDLEIGLADEDKLSFDQPLPRFNVKKIYMQRVLLNLTLNSEY